MAINLKDITFEIDDFGKNKVVSGSSAEVQQLYNLFMMIPGDCEDDPEKGLNINQYKIGLADETALLVKTSIEAQVSKYCDFQLTDIVVDYKDGQLIIAIETATPNNIILFRTTDTNDVLTNLVTS